jgi:hypothetical protein
MNALLDDYLSRFGNEEQQAYAKNPKVKTVSTLTPETDVIATSKSAEGLLQDSASKASERLAVDADIPKASGGISSDKAQGLLEAVPETMAIVDNFSGGQFDTSAEGPGVGKRDGAVLQGASQGASVGGKIGSIAGPKGEIIGTAVGAVAGTVSSWVGHDKAKKEYKENRRKFNKNESAVEGAENAEAYAMSEGLASVENLKALRQKQLGLIS